MSLRTLQVGLPVLPLARTLAFAGMDTTSNALTRILQLLAENQDMQEKLRAEVTAAYEQNGGGNLEFDALSSLPLLDAICKETLRLWPPLPLVVRHALQDAVVPLHKPITTTDGKQLNELVMPKGSKIWISNLQCNRDRDIWGPDATEWKPERWLKPLPESVTEAKIPGVYSLLQQGSHFSLNYFKRKPNVSIFVFVCIQSFRLRIEITRQVPLPRDWQSLASPGYVSQFRMPSAPLDRITALSLPPLGERARARRRRASASEQLQNWAQEGCES